MGFNLDDMIGKYKDFSRGYLFYARVSAAPVPFDTDHPYLVNATTLPSHTIEPIATNWQGREYKIGGTQTFEDMTVTFKADVSQDLRSTFVNWMKIIHDPVSNIHGDPAGYFGRLDLSQLNTNGQPVMSYSLVNAWPSTVGEVSLDYGNKEFVTFDVTFTYQYFLVDNVYDGAETATDVQL